MRTLLPILICCFSVLHAQELKRYRMYSDHFTIDGYTKQYERTFDQEGIIKQKNEYHALTISLYGIMCYDAYLETKDATYLKAVEDQYKYFKDSSKLDVLFDGKGIGLPYKFRFHDLTPPWYSGLTQGIATSFLLRYADLKNSEEALDLAKKVAYTMLVPVSQGGTLSQIPEGGLWIEEYPNTKKSKHVLNGFINGLVGLKEYTDFFPEDTMAKRIHDEVYRSFKTTLTEYDTPKNWSCYDRNNKSISVAYLRIQLTQLDHLYSIYKDEFLLKQMHIWGRMMIGKTDKELKFYKNPVYQYTIGIGSKTDTEFDLDYSEVFSRYLSVNEAVNCINNKGEDLLTKEGYRSKKKMVIIPEPIVYSMDVEAMNTGKKTRVMVYSQGNRTESWFNPNLEYQNFSAGAPIDSLVITRKQAFNKKIQVDRITFYDYRTYELPMFASVNVNGIHEMKKGENYFFSADQSGTDGATIFWRWAELRDKVATSKWHWQQSQGFQEVFVPMTDGYYEFFISYPISSARSTLRNVEISTGK